MTNTVSKANVSVSVNTSLTGGTSAKHEPYIIASSDMKTGGSFTPDKVLSLQTYSLTVAAGNLDIDLYDLGTLDVGAGAGRDNLGNTWAQGKVHSIMIHNTEGSAGNLRIDQNGLGATAFSGAWGATAVIDIPPGGMSVICFAGTGATVTDVTDHVIRLSAQTGDCSINVHITAST